MLLAGSLLLLGVLWAGCAKKVVRPGDGAGDPTDQGQVISHEVVPGETLRRIADNYYGDPDEALRIARDNELADPDRIVPGSILRLTFSAEQWTSARQRAAALQPYNRGVDLLAQEKLAEAEDQFRLALKTAPDLLAARYNLGLVLLKRGRHDEALPHLVALCEQRPEDTDFRFARGHALFLQTRFSEAAEQFDQVLQIDATHQRASFGLARSLQEAGRKQEARQAWRRYLDLDDTSSWADAARRNLQILDDES